MKFLLISATLLASLACRAEVVLHPQAGNPLIADSIVEQDDKQIVVRIYSIFTRTVPKAGVAKLDDLSKNYTEFKAPDKPRTGTASAPAALTAARRAEIDKLIAAYFVAGADKSKILEEVKKNDAIAWSDVPTLSQAIFKAARGGLKLEEGDHVFGHPDCKGNVHIEVVPSKDPQAKLPVYMVLHGGGKDLGSWDLGGPDFIRVIKKKWSEGIFICPSVLQKEYAEWGGNPLEEVYCKELLKAAKRTWNIDTNRVYLGGYSMGGYGTWHIGGHEADLFASLVSGAGGILIGGGRGETWGWGIIGNLRHVPIAFLHGTADVQAPVWSDQTARDVLDALAKENPSSYQHKYMEYAGADHSGPFPHLEEAIPWALDFKRDPNPTKVTWEPSRECDCQLYWLRVDKPKFFTRLDAERDGNAIKLTTKRIASGFSVMLNDRMIDKDKPVTVTIEGKIAFEGRVYPSLSAMLQSADDKIDEEMFFPARIDF
jgi:hypothetical protein